MVIIWNVYNSILFAQCCADNLLVNVDRAKLWLSVVESIEKGLSLVPFIHQVYDRSKHSIHSGSTNGGIDRGIFPQLEALPPLDPTVRWKKMQKISYFQQIVGFLPPQRSILPPQCPHKNISGVTTDHTWLNHDKWVGLQVLSIFFLSFLCIL